MKTKEEFQLVSRIVSIKLVEFKLEPQNVVDLNKSSIVFDHNVNIKIEKSTNLVLINSTTNIFSDSTKKIKLGSYIVSGEYEIQNLEEIVTKYSGKIPTNILVTFLGVQLSTSRGFLITKTEGTELEGVIFGLIDPATFFQQDTTITV
jgi:hypothetical protein